MGGCRQSALLQSRPMANACLALMAGFEHRDAEPEHAIWIVNADTGAKEHVLDVPTWLKLENVGWADEQHVYYEVGSRLRTFNARDKELRERPQERVTYRRTAVFSLEKGTTAMLMNERFFLYNISLTDLQAPIEGDPGFGRMATYIDGVRMYRVNLDTGKSEEFVKANPRTEGYVLDERGIVQARLDNLEPLNRWKLYVYDQGKARVLWDRISETKMPLELRGRLADGRLVVVDPLVDGEYHTLLAVDPVSGEAESLYSTGASPVKEVKDPWAHHIVGASWIDDLPQQHFFDEQLATVSKSMQAHFQGGYATLVSWSRDRSRILVFGERAEDAGAYYLYEPATDRLRIVGPRYPALTGIEHLGVRQAIKYRARDDTLIPAYLTLPAVPEPQKLPLVVLIHDGPNTRADFTFDWWASFLASRGYAVLQPNFRGSWGYGRQWHEAGRGGWGTGVMQTDVDDGVTTLIRSGLVDPSRVCIMGHSYGGYSALAGATFTSWRYKCAISVNGIADTNILFTKDFPNTRYWSKWWKQWRLSTGESLAQRRKVNPIRHADRVLVPVLLIHAVDNTTISVERSRSMAEALQLANKRVRLVELPGDDHLLTTAATRTRMLKEVEAFLAEHLPTAADP